jgi:ribonuclease G
LDAAKEIARQIRLRDLGGIVIVDFIDMRNQSHKKDVYDAVKSAMEEDRAKHTILPLSKFGLMQITRQRVRPQIHTEDSEPCPLCHGTGVAQKQLSVTDEIENRIKTFISEKKRKKATLKVHPYLYAYYTKGLFSIRFEWFMKYKIWVNIISDDTILMNQYDITE